jgi:5'-phosphate synthase pdxT subunit
VTEVGEGVRVLAKRGGDPVLLQQEKVLAATFHPELTDGSPVVDLFVRILSALG